jgi:hypothetical protein
MMRRRQQQLTLGDVIKVVSQVSHGDHEMILVVADLINRGLVKLRGPYKHTKVVRANH